MNPRHKRAALWATGALLLGMIPLIGRVWLENHGALDRPDLGVVGEFVLRDTSDQPLMREQLRRSVSVVFYWPAECQAAGSCVQARENAESTKAWVESYLTAKWGEDKNPLHLIIAGAGSAGLFDGASWRRFPTAVEKGTLIPEAIDTKEPHIIVIDNMLQFAVMEPLNKPVLLPMLERALSKTAFDQYLGNYLSKRTFMGPRRTAP